MSRNRQTQSDRQIFIKWLILVLLGFAMGMGAGYFSEEIVAFLEQVMGLFTVNGDVIAWITLGIFILANVLVYSLCFWNYRKAKRIAGAWSGEDDGLDEVEELLNRAMVPGNIMLGCNYFLYPLTMYVCGMDGDTKKTLVVVAMVGVVVFVGAMICSIVLKSKVVDLEKQLNPEKRGNIFDKHFAKEWEESCDEAQKWIMYEAAYRAYQAAGGVCSFLWLVSVLGMVFFGSGLLPVFCVSAIWITLISVYSVWCAKLESHK